jgi:hypothetical protein
MAFAQRLAAVDDPQPHALGVQAAIDQIRQQRGHHPRGLGGAFAQPQNVLVALGVDAHRQQDHPLAEVDAVDHHHRQIQLADGARQPLRQLLLAELHEAARDGALGGRARPVGRRHRLLGAGVAAGGHARSDGRHRGRVQRVVVGSPLEAGQGQFSIGHRARPRPAHRNALAAEHDLSWRAAAAYRAPPGVGHALGPAQRDAVGLHQGGQHLLASVDAQAQEGVAHIAQHALHGQRDLHLRSRQCPQRGLRARLHLGGSFLCLLGTWMVSSRRKEPPPSAHAFNRLRDIARQALREDKRLLVKLTS